MKTGDSSLSLGGTKERMTLLPTHLPVVPHGENIASTDKFQTQRYESTMTRRSEKAFALRETQFFAVFGSLI